jgi:hypothetical protein
MSHSPREARRKSPPVRRFALCVCDGGYRASLEAWKIYPVLDDRDALRHRLLRVIDESGEDYLFPRAWFRPVAIPAAVRRLYRTKVPA